MTRQAELELFRDVLADGGYTVQDIELEDVGRALAAETPYALVVCFAAEWEELEDRVEHAQAGLTNLAATHPSPRSWDLYVVAVLQRADPRFDAVREALESDTRYARKIVVTAAGGTIANVERALRPLLPLRPVAKIPLLDPLQAVRRELLELGVDLVLVDAALDVFERTSEVRVP
ncbi:MAG: hypothetical protein M3470_09535 [Chloroflexota bacterium]|nr:hypothetical protein [Actinomycetota bacterium]MDQ3401231.1 hypothetical protein [Chloroflexota bacterium]